eukprot:TRINITY_DN9303_c0_g1_i2.p1 TRINITY_DN9303_c0_g1~~TRINITY_DN9303_c0_g1_i2.p1  ORF type:complete len:259 (+),score=38.47 TRINITY_DN9303_c0_g1_i2:591-1367(+)
MTHSHSCHLETTVKETHGSVFLLRINGWTRAMDGKKAFFSGQTSHHGNLKIVLEDMDRETQDPQVGHVEMECPVDEETQNEDEENEFVELIQSAAQARAALREKFADVVRLAMENEHEKNSRQDKFADVVRLTMENEHEKNSHQGRRRGEGAAGGGAARPQAGARHEPPARDRRPPPASFQTAEVAAAAAVRARAGAAEEGPRRGGRLQRAGAAVRRVIPVQAVPARRGPPDNKFADVVRLTMENEHEKNSRQVGNGE